METYRTVQQPASDSFVEKKSRFIGYAKPVQTEEEALRFLNEIKKRHWDATHNVHAYCLREGGVKRYSDDGEPQGTAGIPVLDVLQKSDVTDVAVVVTRYFGGTLLGAGGLVRAYSHAASIALKAAGVVTMAMYQEMTLSCDYNQYGRVSSLIPEMGGLMGVVRYTDRVDIDFTIAEERISSLNKELQNATCGEVEAKVQGQHFVILPEKSDEN